MEYLPLGYIHVHVAVEGETTKTFHIIVLNYTCVMSYTHVHTDPLQSVSIMGLLWAHYCSSFSQPFTPRYLLNVYHSSFEKLPWSLFFPDLASLDSMMKLRLTDNNISSFVFLGQIFPLIEWKTIGATYRYLCRSMKGIDDLYPIVAVFK